MKLTEATPKVLENVYREFENSITESVFDARLSLEIDQQTDEPNISFGFADFELPLGTKPNITFQYDLEKHIQELDEVFGNTINKFREHLIRQFKKYQQPGINSFFEEQEDHYKKYLPENRKNDICIQFVAYCNFPDATPKGYILTDSEKELAKRVYETYSHNYNKLNEVIEKLDKRFSTGEPKAKPEFTMKEIALRYVYEEKAITKENSNEIAKSFGHNSGHKLYLDFNFYSDKTNRKAKPETKKTMENKIELFEKVIEVLPDKYKQKAIDELKILTTAKENNNY
jgi:hypothetical protein